MGIKFGSWVPNGHCKSIGGFNLAVRYGIAICIRNFGGF